MEYRGDTDVPWRKRQLHRLTAPLLGKARQGSSRSAEDAIGTFQRFRGRDVTAQVVPRGRTVVTFSLQCYGLILAEMNPDEHSQGIVWQGRAGNGIGIGMGDGGWGMGKGERKCRLRAGAGTCLIFSGAHVDISRGDIVRCWVVVMRPGIVQAGSPCMRETKAQYGTGLTRSGKEVPPQPVPRKVLGPG